MYSCQGQFTLVNIVLDKFFLDNRESYDLPNGLEENAGTRGLWKTRGVENTGSRGVENTRSVESKGSHFFYIKKRN